MTAPPAPPASAADRHSKAPRSSPFGGTDEGSETDCSTEGDRATQDRIFFATARPPGAAGGATGGCHRLGARRGEAGAADGRADSRSDPTGDQPHGRAVQEAGARSAPAAA